MIEANENVESNIESTKSETPEVIKTSMILEDLENGLDRKAIAAKYSLKPGDVTLMFKHPALKGKKSKKKKALPFNFVDDTTDVDDTANLSTTTEQSMRQANFDDAENQDVDAIGTRY